MPFDPRSLVLYPDQPGVYLMRDEKGIVLYVGKAKNLRARLKQYFAESGDQREMVPYLIMQVEAIDTIIALTEKDALILENNLIKLHKPKYNVLLKDDKTFVSLVVTRHKWPMIRIVRYKDKPKDNGTYFGPYTNALAARQTFDLISRLFPLRQCSDAELASRDRPCLLYDIKRCIAPCVHKCTEEEYGKHVEAAMRLAGVAPGELRPDATGLRVAVTTSSGLVLRPAARWEVRFGAVDRFDEKLSLVRRFLRDNAQRARRSRRVRRTW